MNATLLVMIGGALGAAARFHLGAAAGRLLGGALPWGTLIANVGGGFLMGLLVAAVARGAGEPWRLLLGVGLLGGFTTFSAFSAETVALIERGEAMAAVGYVAISVAGALIALWLGLIVARGAA